MTVPLNITKEHVIRAMKKIDKEGITNRKRNAKKYLVEYNGKTYPPKLVISLANIFANSKELPYTKFHGGNETNDILKALGFKIIEK